MNKVMYWFLGLVVSIGLVAAAIPFMPKGSAKVGLKDGQLTPCPNTPNCVCSEFKTAPNFIEPLIFDNDTQTAWNTARQAITSTGGTIVKEEPGYIWATYTSDLMRFIDDVEFRMDAESGQIHLRSASRLGRSDFGVNHKRVEMLRQVMNNK